jgi:REP element-mobilizing transposase RayT
MPPISVSKKTGDIFPRSVTYNPRRGSGNLMHIISRDSPCYYLTSVARDRLPIFRTEAIKVIACSALDEARRSGKFALYAYVIMPDHIHVITDSILSATRTLQFINGITGRRIIDYLKEQNHEGSLKKLRHEIRPRRYSYSLWTIIPMRGYCLVRRC